MKELEDRLKRSLVEMGSDRYDNTIHASNLINFCPREYCLCQENKKMYNRNSRPLNPNLALTFHIGNAIHDIAKRMFEKAGLLVANEYKASVSYKEKLEITGAWDDVIRTSEDAGPPYTIVDVKSIASGQYKQLNAALDKHKQQLRVYMWQAKQLKKDINTDLGYILYIPKEMCTTPIKLFPVKHNTKIEKEIEESLDSVIEYKETGVLPRRDCQSLSDYRAKECANCTQCFNRIEDTLIIDGGEEVVPTKKKPSKRKSKPESNGKDDTGKSGHRDSGWGRLVPSPIVFGEQVREKIHWTELVAPGSSKQQKEGYTRSPNTRNRSKASK